MARCAGPQRPDEPFTGRRKKSSAYASVIQSPQYRGQFNSSDARELTGSASFLVTDPHGIGFQNAATQPSSKQQSCTEVRSTDGARVDSNGSGCDCEPQGDSRVVAVLDGHGRLIGT